MKAHRKWEYVHLQATENEELRTKNIVEILLNNRGLKTKKEVEDFLNPKLESVTLENVGIDIGQVKKGLKRIKKAIEHKEKIVVFGDYDVDGITGTAILWETLFSLGADVMPFIPSRVEEGYGLSLKGIENCKLQIENLSLIITVDNGIVANEAVNFAKENGIDVIITDHHTVGKKLPDALAIIHTTKLCGAAVAFLLSREVRNVILGSEATPESTLRLRSGEKPHPSLLLKGEGKLPLLLGEGGGEVKSEHLALVALATVADLVPLTGANRTLLKFGLEALKKTTRPGLLALFEEAQIDRENLDVYAIGHVIGPRLNAMGRMESAMDSLRLLCTKDNMRARVLANKLGVTNRERQVLTKSLGEHAIAAFSNKPLAISEKKKLLFIADDSYEQGIIGLVAGKLVEEFYRPAIVLAKGEKYSKASARSVSGFNIIEFIRSASHLLVDAGGHPMAAGFTVETEKILELQKVLEDLAEEQLHDGLLTRILKIDSEIPLDLVSQELFNELQKLGPFGMANFEPIFASKVVIQEARKIGAEGKHLKLRIKPVIARSVVTKQSAQNKIATQTSFARNDKLNNGNTSFNAIAFGMGEMFDRLKPGQEVEMAYTVDENVWNGTTELQLKVKDIKQ